MRWHVVLIAAVFAVAACTTASEPAATPPDQAPTAGQVDEAAQALEHQASPESPPPSSPSSTPSPTSTTTTAGSSSSAAAPQSDSVTPIPVLAALAGAPPSVEIKKPKDGRLIDGILGPGGLGAYVDLAAKTSDPVIAPLDVRWEIDGQVIATGVTANDVWIPRSPSDQHVTIVAIGSSNGIDAAIDQVTIEITPSIEIEKPKVGAVFPGIVGGSGNAGAYIDLAASTRAGGGDVLAVRWEVGGVTVATGARPNDVWIPRGASDTVVVTAIGSFGGVDVAIDQVAIRIGPTLDITKPDDGRTYKGESDPTLGTYLDLAVDVDPLEGTTVTVRWEVAGSVVATGESVKRVWIPRGPDDQAVTIVAIASIDGVDVASDEVTVFITPSLEIRKPRDGSVFEGGFDPVLGRGALVELNAKTVPFSGDSMTVRWEIGGVVVATGAEPGEIWIPSTVDVDAVTIVAIGTVDGDDVARDEVTIIIFAPSDA